MDLFKKIYRMISKDSRLVTTVVLTPEEARQEEFVLRKRMLAGGQISFSQCNHLLDSVNDVDLWMTIAKNHLGQPNRPLVDILNNCFSERTVDFMEMVYRIITAGVTVRNEWVRLPSDFIKNIIVFSRNKDALYCIADMQKEDLLDAEYDENLFNEIKVLAYDRYNYLTMRR